MSCSDIEESRNPTHLPESCRPALPRIISSTMLSAMSLSTSFSVSLMKRRIDLTVFRSASPAEGTPAMNNIDVL